MKKSVLLIVSLVSLLFLSTQLFAATPVDEMFERYVALGDSLTHGFQGGAVDETRQVYSYPNQIAAKMGTEFNQPLLKFPGYLVNIEDVGKGNISWWQYYYPLVGGSRVDGYSNQGNLNNYGITGTDIAGVQYGTGSEGGFYKLVLGSNGAPAVEQALDQDPTFVSVWLGNNDVLGAALWCDVTKLTPIDEFETNYQRLVNELQAKSSIQGIVVLNVPDVTCIAYLDQANSPSAPAGSMKPFWLYEATDEFVLTPDDIAEIQARQQAINEIIYDLVAANGWAFVDASQEFTNIKNYGHQLLDQQGVPTGDVVNTEYLGGVFSLDGVHASCTGYSIAANFIIDGINQTYSTQLDYVDEAGVAASDSLYQDPYDPRGLVDGWVGQALYFAVDIFESAF